MNFRKIKKNFRRNQKAISPVIATLLMIAIAVVASLVAYAWVMGYMGFTTEKTGKAIQIQSVSLDGHIYVQNVGNSQVKLSNPCVYVDGASISATTGTGTILVGGTADLSIGGTAFAASTHTYTIKVTSEDGTFSQINKNFPLP